MSFAVPNCSPTTDPALGEGDHQLARQVHISALLGPRMMLEVPEPNDLPVEGDPFFPLVERTGVAGLACSLDQSPHAIAIDLVCKPKILGERFRHAIVHVPHCPRRTLKRLFDVEDFAAQQLHGPLDDFGGLIYPEPLLSLAGLQVSNKRVGVVVYVDG